MKLSEQLEKLLDKMYEPLSLVEMHYRGKDIAFKTDDNGNPVLLFIGRKNVEGKIKGERYVRTFKKDRNNVVIKDHWELKGKAS